MGVSLRAGMFIGIESYNWDHQTFIDHANAMKSQGVNTLIVKIADGGDLWYGGWSGIQGVLQAITSTGIQVLPYFFSYGGWFNYLDGEIAQANQVLSMGYDVCLDCETVWNGHTDWASAFVAGLHAPVWISTWADPNEQNWNGVLAILKAKTRYFMPQVYTPFLQEVWKQEYGAAGIPLSQISPTVNNQCLLAAAGLPNCSMWEIQEMTDQQIHEVISSLAPESPPSPGLAQQMLDVWNSTKGLFGGTPPPYTTGIALAWQESYKVGQVYGPPVTMEFSTVDWTNLPIQCQYFANGVRIEWYLNDEGYHKANEHHAYVIDHALY